MSTPNNIELVAIRDWWDHQARTNPESAGMLSVFGAVKCSALYRQNSEWHHLKHIAALNDTMRVLELGCGAGRWALSMSPHVRNVVAVDFSEEMIQLARKRAGQAGINNVQFFVGAAQTFLGSGSFDLIYLSSVDQYLDDASFHQTLAQAAAMLTRDGTLIDRVTISASETFFCDSEDGYKCVYRSLPDLQSAFFRAGFELQYHAPSHRPMRLARLTRLRPFTRFLEWALKSFPRFGCAVVEAVTRTICSIRPSSEPPEDRSHDFLLFRPRTVTCPEPEVSEASAGEV
jgi:ubiquinone/menaquinone biosynthesis C-methylase UbiE